MRGTVAAVLTVVVACAGMALLPSPAFANDPPPPPDGYREFPKIGVQTVLRSTEETFPRCEIGVYVVFDGDYGTIPANNDPNLRNLYITRYYFGGTYDGPTLTTGKHVIAGQGVFADQSTTFSGFAFPTSYSIYRSSTAGTCGFDSASIAQSEAVADKFILYTQKDVPAHDPVAGFTWEVSDALHHEVTFTNTSSDQEDGIDLTSTWTFDDGGSSTERDPVHQFDEAGDHEVTLTVTDKSGAADTHTATVTVTEPELVVNSTGDGAATDPALGCDTGGTVDGDPECTLRAAIQAADAAGGGEVRFDIGGGGTPTITAATALPDLSTSIVLDGTTQPGGAVQLMASGTSGLKLTGGTSTVSGMSIRGADVAVDITGGSAHEVRGNWLGTDAAGATADDTGYGVTITAAPGVTVEDNLIGAADGVVARTGSDGTKILDNTIGIATDGTTPFSTTLLGVGVRSPGATVTGNVIQARTAGVLVFEATATGATVQGNTIGQSADLATDFPDQSFGVYADAAPGTTIAGNHIASARGGVVITGSLQSTVVDDQLELGDPGEDDPVPGAVTGGTATVTGNTVEGSRYGVVAWAGAPTVTVDDNTLGSGTHPVALGVSAQSADDIVIGTAAKGNTVVATEIGVEAVVGSDRPTITGNSLTAIGTDSDTGVLLEDDARSAKVTGNTVVGFSVGIEGGPGSTVSTNTVAGGLDGISVSGADVTVKDNRVGLAPLPATTVVGVGRVGIEVQTGKAVVSGNKVAGSGAAGIDVLDGATATLTSNAVWQSAGLPISVADGPAAPTLDAVVQTGSGDGLRRTLVVSGLPEGDAGTLEVFGNASCTGGGGEAEKVLNIKKAKKAADKVRIIQVLQSSLQDNFTLTYTDSHGRTSQLSGCVGGQTYPDSDGDGSPDPFDDTYGFGNDPRAGVIVTDQEQLLMVGTLYGQLEQLGVTDDPAPGSHPAGWSQSYGTIGFKVTGLEPGGRTAVILRSLDSGVPVTGNAYWKYGPASAGASPSWYAFGPDDATGTGALIDDAYEFGGVISKSWVLLLQDGQRGDSDWSANGTIVDPGGPVLYSPPPVVQPPDKAVTGATVKLKKKAKLGKTISSAVGATQEALRVTVTGKATVKAPGSRTTRVKLTKAVLSLAKGRQAKAKLKPAGSKTKSGKALGAMRAALVAGGSVTVALQYVFVDGAGNKMVLRRTQKLTL